MTIPHLCTQALLDHNLVLRHHSQGVCGLPPRNGNAGVDEAAGLAVAQPDIPHLVHGHRTQPTIVVIVDIVPLLIDIRGDGAGRIVTTTTTTTTSQTTYFIPTYPCYSIDGDGMVDDHSIIGGELAVGQAVQETITAPIQRHKGVFLWYTLPTQFCTELSERVHCEGLDGGEGVGGVDPIGFQLKEVQGTITHL